MIDTQTRTYKKSKAEACHCAEPKPGGACCDLICFERPNYFCGHLLTDTDLSTEQRYAIEKRKLHNRTLHGWGVVCGLRMTCDDECGGVMIDEGYALDDCGNDLVVCQPLRFDVIGKLREKGYLVGDAAYDPCKPKEEQDDCKIRQCFYITICYEEEAREFTTPFVAGCRPSLTECEPTRIREGVTFDVLNELPKETGWLEELEFRIKHCAKLFTEGQFAKKLQDNLGDITIAIGGNADSDPKWWELFCGLRGLLLLYLSKHPDKYNCTLNYEIQKIPFPQDPAYDTNSTLPRYDEPNAQERYREGRTHLGENYSGDVGAAFCRLLELAHQHVVSCILGEMIFPCKEPCEPACVVLGTVEVVGDKVVHVCNCPRSYVWSFGAFWEVIIATVLGGLACEETPVQTTPQDPMPTTPPTPVPGQPTGTQRTGQQPAGARSTSERWPGRTDTYDEYDEGLKRICCSVTKFDCQEFITRLQANQKTIYDGSTAALQMFAELRQSLRYAFDFTRPETLSPSTFKGMNTSRADPLAKYLKVNLHVQDQPLEQQILEPLQAFRSNTLSGPERDVYAYQSGGQIVDVRAEWREAARLDPAVRAEIDTSITRAQAEAETAKKQVAELGARLNKIEDLIQGIGTGNDPKIAEIRRKIMETLAAEEIKGGAKKAATKKPRRRAPRTEGGENG